MNRFASPFSQRFRRQRRMHSPSGARWLLLIPYALPALATLVFILRFAVDVPYMDSYALLDTFAAIDRGELTLAKLWVTHNEHRIFFPRLMAASLAFLTGWSTYFELILSWILAVFSFSALCWLSWRSRPPEATKNYHHCLNIAVGILFFSFVQHENWLWGFQVAWFWIVLCLLIAVSLIVGRHHPSDLDRRFWLAALFCLFASFSSAHGMLTWIAIAPSILFAGTRIRDSIVPFCVWSCLTISTITRYLSDYKSPPNPIDRSYAFEHPLAGIQYFLGLLGNSFLAPGTSISIVIFLGIVTLACFGYFILQLWNDRTIQKRVFPWLSIGLFVIGFCMITTFGRAALGIRAGLSSRYTTITVLLILSVMYLGEAFITRVLKYRKKEGFVLACCLVVVASLNSSFQVWGMAQHLHQDRQDGKTCLMLSNYMQAHNNQCLHHLFPDSSAVVNHFAPILGTLGFQEFIHGVRFLESQKEVYGMMELPDGPKVEVSPESVVVLTGWSILPDRQQVPELVFFEKNGSKKFFAHARVNIDSPDVAAYLGSSAYKKSRWKLEFPANILMEPKTLVSAWAYDPEQQYFIQLVNSIELSYSDQNTTSGKN